METMFGVLLGYVLRGTTGSEGFREVMESARAVTGSREFQSLVDATRSHAAQVIRDLSESLSQNAGHVAYVVGGGAPTDAAVEPAEWEAWPPSPRTQSRPFSDDLPWPDR